MADERLNIVLAAQNLTGNAFRQVSNQLNRFENHFARIQNRYLNNFPRKFRFVYQRVRNELQSANQSVGMLNGGLLAVGATVGVTAIAFNRLGDSIGNAINRQVENVAAVNTAIQTLGLSGDKAETFVERFNKSVGKLGRDLPVTSENIAVFSRSILDDYAIGLRAAGATTEQISDRLLQDASRLALTTQLAGKTIGQGQSAIAAFLGGSITTAGFNQYDYFRDNVQLKNAILTRLESRGVTSTKELSITDRVNLLSQALEEAVPESSINRLRGTTKAKVSAFFDTLFSPEVGLFSIQRDLEANIKGYQSVFTSFERTLDLLIGSRGILAQFGRISGIGDDTPLRAFRSGVDRFNNFLESFVGLLSGINIGDSTAVSAAVGKYSALAVNAFFDGILGAMVVLDYGAILKGFGAGLLSFFTNLDWKVYAAGAVALVGVFLFPIIKAALITLGGFVVSGLVAVFGGIPLLIIGAIGLGIAALVKLIADNWAGIKRFSVILQGAVTSWYNNVLEAIRNLFQSIIDSVKKLVASAFNLGQTLANNAIANTQISAQLLGDAIAGRPSPRYMGNIPTAANGLFNALAIESLHKPQGSNLVIANDSEYIFTPNQFSNLVKSLSSGQQRNINININSGAISINQAGSNSEAVAHKVIQMIENKLVSELNSIIS